MAQVLLWYAQVLEIRGETTENPSNVDNFGDSVQFEVRIITFEFIDVDSDVIVVACVLYLHLPITRTLNSSTQS